MNQNKDEITSFYHLNSIYLLLLVWNVVIFSKGLIKQSSQMNLAGQSGDPTSNLLFVNFNQDRTLVFISFFALFFYFKVLCAYVTYYELSRRWPKTVETLPK